MDKFPGIVWGLCYTTQYLNKHRVILHCILWAVSFPVLVCNNYHPVPLLYNLFSVCEILYFPIIFFIHKFLKKLLKYKGE